MKRAAYQITLGGRNITSIIKPRFMGLTLTECRGEEADQFDLILDDTDGLMDIPPKGEKIEVQIGWTGEALVNKGTFIVDEVGHQGAPDRVTLRARTADLIDNFRELKERSFHDTTVGAIVEVLCFEHDLASGCADDLRKRPIPHIDQTRESDANFLRRLGKQFDAVATIKNDVLLFIPAAASRTVSGKPLPVINITRRSGDNHNFQAAERDSYSGVRAYWYDKKRTTRRSVLAGVSGNAKRLRTTFATERDALQAASTEWQRVQRGIYRFDLNLAVADPQAVPQSPVKVSGFKKIIDETDWLATRIVTTINDEGGMTSQLMMETKSEEGDDSPIEPMEDPDSGITGVTAKWLDKVSKKSGEQTAGKPDNIKMLKRIYASKQSAKRAAKLEWHKITERREAIAENEE